LALATPGVAVTDQNGGLGDTEGRLKLDITTMTPRVVTSDAKRIQLAGRITNAGDRNISHIRVRLQLSDVLNNADQVRGAMADPPVTGTHDSPFIEVSPHLQPGQSADIKIDESLTDGELHMRQPGVYPLTVNVNGEPDYGGVARLASLNMLLPVRSVPGEPAPKNQPKRPPVGLTMLWPIEGTSPRRVGSTPSGQLVLSDDGLARSMSDGGRLRDLVQTAQDRLGNDPKLNAATCFAIDPDLVRTAQDMSEGYQVRTGNSLKQGTGTQAAKDWLGALAAVTDGRCVVPLPYADADLVALARAGSVDLEKQALDVSALNDALKGAKIQDNVVSPIDGMLDDRTMSDITSLNSTPTTALLDPQNIGTADGAGPHPVSGVDNGNALINDSLVSKGMLGEEQASGGAQTPSETPADIPSMASQNGIATLIFRAKFDPQRPKSVLATPPRRWNTNATDLNAWADAAQQLLSDGSAKPVSLSSRLKATPGSKVSLSYPQSAAADEIPPSVTASLASNDQSVRDLLGSMQLDPSKSVQPTVLTSGLQQELLRAVSGVWRGNAGAAKRAARDADRTLSDFTGQVSVIGSRLPANLASKDSKLPVSVHNSLPVTMKIRLWITAAGLRTDSPYIEGVIPARGSRTFTMPVTVLRAGQFNVDIRATTTGQTQLGKTVRLDVVSSAYGAVTLAVTGTAFSALILLSARRIYRRVKAAKTAGADNGAKEQ
jgi:hypothetical protein